MAVGLRNYQKKILIVRVLIIVFLIIVILLSISVFRRFTIEREMYSRREEAVGEELILKEREAQVRQKVEYLGRESSREAEIRENFDVAREGEQVIILVDDVSTSTIEPFLPPRPVEKDPWYIFWR